MKSKSQIYSQIVFENIAQLVKEHTEENKSVKRYKSLVKRSGGLLRSVGLIQFLSFLAAKAAGREQEQKHHIFLLNHLTDELNKLKILTVTDRFDLIKKIQSQELPQYMRVTQDILKLLQWHRRISDILISGTAEEE
jgi:CRISPR type III-B/RAMP module-associated protein Cmr5